MCCLYVLFLYAHSCRGIKRVDCGFFRELTCESNLTPFLQQIPIDLFWFNGSMGVEEEWMVIGEVCWNGGVSVFADEEANLKYSALVVSFLFVICFLAICFMF
jgi:hypothetical protein